MRVRIDKRGANYLSAGVDVEAADDFVVEGTIQRVVVDGFDCFNCAPATVLARADKAMYRVKAAA